MRALFFKKTTQRSCFNPCPSLFCKVCPQLTFEDLAARYSEGDEREKLKSGEPTRRQKAWSSGASARPCVRLCGVWTLEYTLVVKLPQKLLLDFPSPHRPHILPRSSAPLGSLIPLLSSRPPRCSLLRRTFACLRSGKSSDQPLEEK